jgi:hypothetical protein
MFLDLSLRLDDKAEVHPIAGDAGGDADREGARVPERIEQRRPVVELAKALLRPGEMLLLLARGHGELVLDGRIAGEERLRGVERLRADLTGVIDAHQPRRMTPLVGRQGRFFEIRPGVARAAVGTPASVQRASRLMMKSFSIAGFSVDGTGEALEEMRHPDRSPACRSQSRVEAHSIEYDSGECGWLASFGS